LQRAVKAAKAAADQASIEKLVRYDTLYGAHYVNSEDLANEEEW